jgi:hypothetical protein
MLKEFARFIARLETKQLTEVLPKQFIRIAAGENKGQSTRQFMLISRTRHDSASERPELFWLHQVCNSNVELHCCANVLRDVFDGGAQSRRQAKRSRPSFSIGAIELEQPLDPSTHINGFPDFAEPQTSQTSSSEKSYFSIPIRLITQRF